MAGAPRPRVSEQAVHPGAVARCGGRAALYTRGAMTVSAALLHALRTRLLARPRPGCWLGLVIRAFPATDDPSGGPVHWLLAGWAPDAGGLYPRLPEFAAIASPDRDRALAELFVHLPPAEPVHLVSPERVDAALVGEMVLAVDRHLQPWQRDGLQAFVAAQREAERERIRARYTDREAGFERLMRGLPGLPGEDGG